MWTIKWKSVTQICHFDQFVSSKLAMILFSKADQMESVSRHDVGRKRPNGMQPFLLLSFCKCKENLSRNATVAPTHKWITVNVLPGVGHMSWRVWITGVPFPKKGSSHRPTCVRRGTKFNQSVNRVLQTRQCDEETQIRGHSRETPIELLFLIYKCLLELHFTTVCTDLASWGGITFLHVWKKRTCFRQGRTSAQ